MDWLLASVNTAYVAVFQGSQKPEGERPPTYAAHAKELAAALAIADGHLEGQDWFALGRMTLADIALAPIFKRCLGFPIERPAFSNLDRWMAAIASRPAFQAATGGKLRLEPPMQSARRC